MRSIVWRRRCCSTVTFFSAHLGPVLERLADRCAEVGAQPGRGMLKILRLGHASGSFEILAGTAGKQAESPSLIDHGVGGA